MFWLLLLIAIGGMFWAYLDYSQRFPDKKLPGISLFNKANVFGGKQRDASLIDTTDPAKLVSARREIESVLADIAELEEKLLTDRDPNWGPEDSKKALLRLSKAFREAQQGASGEDAQELGVYAEFYEALQVLWTPYHDAWIKLERSGVYQLRTNYRNAEKLRAMRDYLEEMKESNVKLASFYARLPQLLRQELQGRPISQDRRNLIYNEFKNSYDQIYPLLMEIRAVDAEICTKAISIVNYLRVRTEDKPQAMACDSLADLRQAHTITVENFINEIDRLSDRQRELVKQVIRVKRMEEGKDPNPEYDRV